MSEIKPLIADSSPQVSFACINCGWTTRYLGMSSDPSVPVWALTPPKDKENE